MPINAYCSIMPLITLQYQRPLLKYDIMNKLTIAIYNEISKASAKFEEPVVGLHM